MKAIYNCCIADPFARVAEVLRDEHGYDPIYWIGYEYDDSPKLIPELFPGIIYQEYWDAWRGIFCEEVQDLARGHVVDLEFLERNARHELQALKMMDRMDPDRHSFSFMERQRHYRNLVRHWDAFVRREKPDLLVNAVTPHRVFDYVLYLVCRYHGVKIISFCTNSFRGRIMPMHDLLENEPGMAELYAELRESGETWPLSPDIQEQYDKARRDYATGQPEYMIKHAKTKRANSSIFKVGVNFLKYVTKDWRNFFGGRGHLQRGFHPYWARPDRPIEDSQYKFLRYSRKRSWTLFEKKRLEKLYRKIAVKPDFERKYIYFGLHYQPEATTMPEGDVFADQLMAPSLLAANTPEDWVIYVKENPYQFNHLSEGQTVRQESYYLDAIRNPKIQFVEMSADSFELIDHAQAVSTIRGTVGWEGMARGKPVIIFGHIWYEFFEGVLRIRNDDDAHAIPAFLDDYRYSQTNLEAYLRAFDRFSVHAYHYLGMKELAGVSEEECVDTLVRSVLEFTG